MSLRLAQNLHSGKSHTNVAWTFCARGYNFNRFVNFGLWIAPKYVWRPGSGRATPGPAEGGVAQHRHRSVATAVSFRDELDLVRGTDVEPNSPSICDETDLAVADNVQLRPPLSA